MSLPLIIFLLGAHAMIFSAHPCRNSIIHSSSEETRAGCVSMSTPASPLAPPPTATMNNTTIAAANYNNVEILQLLLLR